MHYQWCKQVIISKPTIDPLSHSGSKNIGPLIITLEEAISDTDRWVWMVSNCSRHQSNSSKVSTATLIISSGGEPDDVGVVDECDLWCIVTTAGVDGFLSLKWFM